MSEGNKNIFNTIFEAFVKDVKSAVITCLIIAVIYQWYQNGQLMQARIDDRDKFKDEVIEEVRRAYDPKFQDIKKNIVDKTGKLDTAINNVNEYVNDKSKWRN